jgi:RND family efflux transporter MFP subunit
VTIVRVNPLRLRAEVPERDTRLVRTGQLVRVNVEGDNNVYTGRIMRLSPSITEQNRMLLIEAEVSNNGPLRPGSFVRAEIVTENSNKVLTIPASAIVTFAGIDKVVIADNGKALEKPVTTGRRIGDNVEILAGLTGTEQVVLVPGNLQSGQPITIEQ